jgi:hypothetical protein
MVFASSAARTSALSGVLAEGMVSYLQDTNAVEVYNGSAWVGVSGAGDVTEVQAGTGISVASGTGPIPVVTNTMATAIDAEGDLIIGDAADAFQRLPIGSNTHVLTVDTSVDGKIKWAAPAGGGKVLQVVSATKTDTFTAASSSAVDVTGLSVSITPSSATSKVLILTTVNANGDAGNNGCMFVLLRGSTQIAYPTSFSSRAAGFGSIYINDAAQIGSTGITHLDSPATTSAITYKIQGFGTTGGSNNFYVNRSKNDLDNLAYVRTVSSITAIEIGA